VSAITFAHVSASCFSFTSFSIEAGSLAAIITPRQEISDLLVRLLLGVITPNSGTIAVMGADPATLSEQELSALRQRIGIVSPSGGLISNLKVWENILLPLEYHQRIPRQEIEERADSALKAVGYGGVMNELPGHLSLIERRLVSQARSFAMKPALLVYNSLLVGLSEVEQGQIVDNALTFHREWPGTTSLFLTTQPETVRSLPLDQRIVLERGGKE
jgi:phospholipid/cholesterol/gamma-HCH transport system ATP-binding protein